MKKLLSRFNKGLISVVLLGISAALGVVIAARAAGYVAECARAEKMVSDAVTLSSSDAEQTNKYFAEVKEKANELKKKNLFSPPAAKKGNPVSQVLGILGSEALINGKWYKVGETIGDAKLVAIEPTCVRVEWEGKQSVFAPLSAVTSSDKERPKGPSEESRSSAAASADSGADRFGADRESMRSRFQNMSEEERQLFRERMRSRRDRGGQESGSTGESSRRTEDNSSSGSSERRSKGGSRSGRGRGSSFSVR